MRWDELFADLEAQLEAGLGAEERVGEAEEERLRLGRLSLRDRIAAMGHGRRPVRIRLVTGALLDLAPRTLGRDWIAGDLAGGAQAILPLTGVGALLPTAEQIGLEPPPPREGALTDRLGLPFVLRDLARRRRTLEVTTRRGVLTGTLDRVGRDHVDLAVHPLDEPRRSTSVVRLEVLPLTEVVLVRVD
ncbi:hypothetical protein QDR37_03200 [Amnibacterium sp. CER49]|uniref:hypothetical protein n=1 Tax=Amnibacterium sp. CER49 TaxID=3039161 RepID=UPI002447084E|nr:hypothetical protein [Amnibacterium sp. CER49]MDH2442945.1 hypothetical protein [Amnibacterium sp. CER49]